MRHSMQSMKAVHLLWRGEVLIDILISVHNVCAGHRFSLTRISLYLLLKCRSWAVATLPLNAHTAL